MSQQFRREVLKSFKTLHRTREQVFQGDQHALTQARDEINKNFRKNRDVADSGEIKKLIQLAKDVDTELRTNVVQAVEKKPGVYEARIREEIPKLDNVPFNPNAVIEKPRRGAAKCGSAPKDQNT